MAINASCSPATLTPPGTGPARFTALAVGKVVAPGPFVTAIPETGVPFRALDSGRFMD